jgi:phosphatidylglycerol:prolipoprotein diacylglycerol transferase
MTPPLAHWVHDLSPFVLKFNETIGIRYYGVAYLAGFFAAWWLLRVYSKRGFTRLTGDQIGDLVTALIVGVMVGGRLGYFLFYHPESLAEDPLILIRIWEGGMASHGGFLGVAAALWWCARRFKLRMLHLADLVVSVAPLGLFFGRVANFINGELWGRPSTVAWAVIFPESDPTKPASLIAPRHPSQLYAAVLEGLLPFAIMQLLVWRTPWLREAPGRIAGAFLVVYAIGRSIGEQFREPDAGLILGLTRGTFYSVFLLLAGVVLMTVCRPAANAKPKPAPKA